MFCVDKIHIQWLSQIPTANIQNELVLFFQYFTVIMPLC